MRWCLFNSWLACVLPSAILENRIYSLDLPRRLLTLDSRLYLRLTGLALEPRLRHLTLRLWAFETRLRDLSLDLRPLKPRLRLTLDLGPLKPGLWSLPLNLRPLLWCGPLLRRGPRNLWRRPAMISAAAVTFALSKRFTRGQDYR